MQATDGIVKGAVTVLGGFVSADIVLPARHSFLPPEEMAEHVLAELSAEVNKAVRARPIIVAGEAFGYGTGRESPARALRAAGVRAIVGGPCARMFFRNAINNGVLVIDCPALVGAEISDGDELEIDAASGRMRWKAQEFCAAPVPEFILNIIAAGGLIAHGRSVVRHIQQDSPA